jgi:hypothetical protein
MTPARHVNVSVRQIRAMRERNQWVAKRVHSDPRMHKGEKIAILKALKETREILDGWLQLELFSDSQLLPP